MKKKYEGVYILILLFLQILFWSKTEKIKPDLSILPELQNIETIKAISFGDEQFYFRVKALEIQNSGDTFGRFTPLKYYDYEKLVNHFKILEILDNKSSYIPSMASYYFSQTQNKNDLIYIIKYLEQYADKDPKNRWWWYYQATFIANHIYNDKKLAIYLSTKLKDASPKDAPAWTKQLLPIILANNNEECESLKIMNDLLLDDKLKPNEINFMKYFIKEKIIKLKENKNKLKNCIL
ncbi:MAG: hypothetical protein LBC92_05395 [Rickettsiales bacterium]|jgi:hypothetical protein|nr:hypothetical protein [Rickettsiales bacterium]